MSTEYQYFQDMAAQVEIPDDGIISRTLRNDDRCRVILFGFDAGQELTEHTSTMAAIVHILSGEAKLGLGGDWMEAQPGSWAYMAPNLAHTIVATTPVVMLLTMFKTPRPSGAEGTSC